MAPETQPGNPDTLTELQREVLRYVPQLAAYFQRARTEMPPDLDEVFTRKRLTARHGAVLAQLLPDRSCTVTDLAGRLGVSLSTVSELVGSLADAGLATRREDPSNRRRTLVSLSERYRPAFEQFIALRATPLLAALGGLSDRDQAGFVAGLAAWSREVQP
ncbi:MAG TPA: MarR family transcriptional regulator [Pseudonocardiaceae bacterium]|jgi:DNA-binding MarR family transcriptional regulator